MPAPHAVPHTGAFQGSKNLSKNAKYDYTRVKRWSRKNAVSTPSALPAQTAPSVHRREYTHKDTDNRWHDVTVSLSMRAHPRRADGGHPRRARATHGSRPRPARTARRNHRSGHHSSTILTICVRYAAVHAIVIKDEQRHSIKHC